MSGNLVGEVAGKMYASRLHGSFTTDELVAAMRGYAETTLLKINSLFSADEQHPLIRASISDAIHRRAEERRILDMVDYLPAMYEEKPFLRICSMALLSLNEYRKLGWIPNEAGSGRNPLVQSFLLTAHQLQVKLHKAYEKLGYDTLSGEYPEYVPFRKVERNDENPIYFVLKDEWLVRLIMEHEEDGDVIIDLICERGSDYELLSRILDAENKSLVSGML